MSVDLVKAFSTQARSVSLWCNSGTSDKTYDIQLIPVATASGIRWNVEAQNGPRTGRKTPRNKCKEFSYASARDIFRELEAEKLGKGYREVASARESDLSAKIAAAHATVTVALPKMNGFDEFYSTTLDYVQSKISTAFMPQVNVVAALADVAYGCPEGVTDAIEKICKTKTPAETQSLLSADIVDWITRPKLEAVATELRDLCAIL